MSSLLRPPPRAALAATLTVAACAPLAPTVAPRRPVVATVASGAQASAARAEPSLEWRIGPPTPDPASPEVRETDRRSVTLVVRDGASAERRFELGSFRGWLSWRHQTACAGPSALDVVPDRRDVIASVAFQIGGYGGVRLARVSEREVAAIAWSATDGACSLPDGGVDACPEQARELARFSLAASGAIAERVVEVDTGGLMRPLACAGD